MNSEQKEKKNNLIKDLVEILSKENDMPVIYSELLKDDINTGVLLLEKKNLDNFEYSTKAICEKAEDLTNKMSDLLYDENNNLLDNFNSYWVEFLNSGNKNTIFGNNFLIIQKKKLSLSENETLDYILVLINSTQLIEENISSLELSNKLTNMISNASDKINYLLNIADKNGISKKDIEDNCLSMMNSLRNYLLTDDETLLDNDPKLKNIINDDNFMNIINSIPGIKDILTSDEFDDIVKNIKENGFIFENNINRDDILNGK